MYVGFDFLIQDGIVRNVKLREPIDSLDRLVSPFCCNFLINDAVFFFCIFFFSLSLYFNDVERVSNVTDDSTIIIIIFLFFL